MLQEAEEALRYPTGRFANVAAYNQDQLESWIGSIRSLPLLLDYCVENLDEEQLNTPYRSDGWNSVQVIHHIADSHMNAYIRLKLALTEETPIIKPYNEKLWAETPDVFNVPVNVSITLIHALHRRWTTLLELLSDADLNKQYHHPADNELVTVWQLIHKYSWHGNHHAEQILSLRRRMNW